ncbi:uncharacterized protein LOC128256338 [Drosophila gunungcola]|uniref:uncharacterized protein LOC128256338 n=1 Tax=Drosophila gunungcola TaxID=103775 RepID=UPI0022E6D183|nr:uncharacterized protein LOC128256338 [Drosophila gunungcola]
MVIQNARLKPTTPGRTYSTELSIADIHRPITQSGTIAIARSGHIYRRIYKWRHSPRPVTCFPTCFEETSPRRNIRKNHVYRSCQRPRTLRTRRTRTTGHDEASSAQLALPQRRRQAVRNRPFRSACKRQCNLLIASASQCNSQPAVIYPTLPQRGFHSASSPPLGPSTAPVPRSTILSQQ